MSYIINNNLKESVTDLFETWGIAAKRSSARSQLLGVGGLTGLCLGFSASCARQLAENGDELPRDPLRTGAYYSKLFLQCVWRNLPLGVQLHELTIQQNPQLVDRMIRDTVEKIALRSGGRTIKRLPKKRGNFYDRISQNPDNLWHKLLDLSKTIKDDRNQSIFIVFSSKTSQLLAWHVICIHPATQTLCDGASELVWRTEKTRHIFLRACMEYIHFFYRSSSYHLLQVQKESDSSPWFTTRFSDMADCTYQIAKRHLPMGAVFAAIHIPLLGRAVVAILERSQNERAPKFFDRLIDLFHDTLLSLDVLKYRFQKFLFLLQSVEQEIPALEIHCKKKGSSLLHSLCINWRELDDVLQLLRGLETLSPKARYAVNVITYQILHELPNRAVWALPTDHPLETLSPLFEQCMKLRKQFRISDISYRLPYNDLILLGKGKFEPMFAHFLRIIASHAEGDLGDIPGYPPRSALYEALENKSFLFAKILLEYGANPVAPFYKGETPLKLVETRMAEGGEDAAQWQEIRTLMEPWTRTSNPQNCLIL